MELPGEYFHIPNNFHGHRSTRINPGILRLPQSGAGLGSILRSFFKLLAPIGKSALKSTITTGKKIIKSKAVKEAAKEAASQLTKDAAEAGINIAQAALAGGDVKDAAKSEAKKIQSNVKQTVSKHLDNLRPERNDSQLIKPRKRKQKRAPSYKRIKLPRDNLS